MSTDRQTILENLAREWGLSSPGQRARKFLAPSKLSKPMNKVGPVTKRRLATVRSLHREALEEGWLHTCEVGPILRERGLTDSTCLGPLTYAHSVKCSKRSGHPELEREVCRSCQYHHYYVLDVQEPEITKSIVLEAIRRRKR